MHGNGNCIIRQSNVQGPTCLIHEYLNASPPLFCLSVAQRLLFHLTQTCWSYSRSGSIIMAFPNVQDKKEEVIHLEDVSFAGKDRDVEAVVIDPLLEKKLLRKVDLHVLPPLFLLFLLAFLDRTNIGKFTLADIFSVPVDLGLQRCSSSCSVCQCLTNMTQRKCTH